jgi:cytochrome b involved in lipid metabolism
MEKIYIMIDNHWFDVTNFNNHPGGKKIFKINHMKDVSTQFNEIKGHYDTNCLSLLESMEVKDRKILEYLEYHKL